jgi:hypothetical protein
MTQRDYEDDKVDSEWKTKYVRLCDTAAFDKMLFEAHI